MVNGLFQAEVEFAASSLDGSPRLLQLGVREAIGGIHDCTSNTIGFLFELLTPLQPISAAPYAIHAFSAPAGSSLNAPDGLPIDALVVDNTGRVGIGTTSPQAKLHIAGTPGTDGIKFPDGTLQTTAYRRLKVSTVFDPPSVAAGGNTTISISVAGAAVGDVAIFNPRVGLPAGLVIGQVLVNTDSVAVRLNNVTANAIDAGSNTADVVVLK